jgi:Uma2 family endonuclease
MSAQRIPTLLEQLRALPDGTLGQILEGALEVSPRPSTDHAFATTALIGDVEPAFQRGRGGPGGWMILVEPELHLASDILIPDIAGWRKARMAEAPSATYLTLAPDWVCEVLSPGTERLDRKVKRTIYAREQVSAYWLVDPIEQTLEVLRLDGADYRIDLVASCNDRVRAWPFEVIELDLSYLWLRRTF